MEKLFMEIEGKSVPIEQASIKKYNLKMGTYSPFTCNRIVGAKGDFPSRPYEKDDKNRELSEIPFEGFHDDGIDQMDHGVEFSTSEIIDIAQGVDSD